MEEGKKVGGRCGDGVLEGGECVYGLVGSQLHNL